MVFGVQDKRSRNDLTPCANVKYYNWEYVLYLELTVTDSLCVVMHASLPILWIF